MDKPKIKRRREIKTCLRCYKHKLKCDKSIPCSNCKNFDTQELCVYGFTKDEITKILSKGERAKQLSKNILTRIPDKNTKDISSTPTPPPTTETSSAPPKKLYKSSNSTLVYRSKYFHPFFTSTINDRLLTSDDYDEFILSKEFHGNPIRKFDRFSTTPLQFQETIQLLPNSIKTAQSIIDTYFDSIHPVLPFLDKKSIQASLQETYNSISNDEPVSITTLTLLYAIFFTSSFATVASGVIPDILICNKYYSAYSMLLPLAKFPFVPNIETLQAFIIVNFIIDPNMVEFVAYSAMLVRIGQQLGLHKISDNANTMRYRILWSTIIYIEGSSSVVAGFPYLSSDSLINSVQLRNKDIGPDETALPYLFLEGKARINILFKKIMNLGTQKQLELSDFGDVREKLYSLSTKIANINWEMGTIPNKLSTYFVNTLNIFLYRLHLRFYALTSSQTQEEKILKKNGENFTSLNDIDISNLLSINDNVYHINIIQVTLGLLFNTYERLIQKDISNFSWYSRGSTIMQYLFVIISDIHQNPKRPYRVSDFPIELKDSLNELTIDIMNKHEIFCKFILVEELIELLEAKLAPLWNNKNLFKLIVVKKLKEKVWEQNQYIFNEEYETMKNDIFATKLFKLGRKTIQNTKMLDLDECLSQWNDEREMFDVQKIINSWIKELSEP
ncbi:hypothetical protein TBLA_0C04000 [Henningerozyma blattae CBS 6284]|uniref:Zn(2)-C6 fungal-type domain-containing protein n=1 Tax=Henningerozyma blattae (strain ATCC 34711 / CBS 6284 / DSM 70876 / NBRC 10599 / NRRL Y-10934 / UCD 77-7) TaxID=1071380 RepID=I2H1E8_HENB6|nr:hypothetical protein TBLA_0C04000 [Tetrapisispora blattae CBS 6284]CCH60200.1 hypothetical protein TBLA_0C04000 [Tetrapisispora blattae CBS 6284]